MRPPLHIVAAALTVMFVAACADDMRVAPTGINPADTASLAVILKPPPTPPPGLLVQFAQISAGDDFTCARQWGGNVYCWGRTDMYQVGRSASGCPGHASPAPCVPAPTRLYKTSTDAFVASSVDAGGQHACLIESGVGQVWCWGAGTLGQLGWGNQYPTQGMPLRVQGMTGATIVGAGFSSSCAQIPTGVWCWGSIGAPDTKIDQISPPALGAPEQWSSANDYSEVSVGESHACGLRPGEFVCWGQPASRYSSGYVNWGQTADPTWVSTIAPWPTTFGSSVAHVATQGATTCVDRSNGQTACTGLNSYGIFGTLSPVTSINPVTVPTGPSGPLHATSVSWWHGCGLDASNAAWCWGLGDWGQLGNGGFSNSPTPVRVSGTQTFRALATGASHTCGITSANELYCWGKNSSGQLGNHLNWSAVPVATAALVP